MHVGAHEWTDIGLRMVAGAAVLHTFLPPWDAEVFQPFPTFQKYYKVFIYLTGYVALHARSTVYKSISTSAIGGVNETVANAEGTKQQ